MTTRAALELWVQTIDAQGWDAGHWDVDPWEVETTWTDVSCDWRGASIAGGRTGPMDRFRAAHAVMRVDNRQGKFNAWSDATPWAGPGSRHLGAGTIARVGVDVTGHPRRYLFTGVADTWHHERDGADRWVEMGCDDPLATLTLANLPEQPSQGANEHAGARLERILAAHGLQSMPHAFDTGVVALQATTLADDAISLADLTADSDGGWLWCDGDGVLQYYQGDRDTTDPRWMTPVLVVGDDHQIAGTICWDLTPQLFDDREAIINHAAIAAKGGTAHTAEDVDSERRYQMRTFQRTDLIHADETYSQTLADKIVRRLSAGGTRPDAVSLTSRSDADAWALINLKWHDRVTFIMHDVGDVYAADCYIDSMQWSLAPAGYDRVTSLNVVLTLSPAAFFPSPGRWDAGLWDHEEWGY